jgi:hypothetical protein
MMVSEYHTPSDPSNEEGMRKEVIRATPSWSKGMPHYGCVLVNSNNELIGMLGMEVARRYVFFFFICVPRYFLSLCSSSLVQPHL